MIYYNILVFGKVSNRRDSGRAANWRRQALTFAALFAVFLQALIVQTHIHVPAAIQLASGYEKSADPEHGAAIHGTASDEAMSCALCQVLSYSQTLLTAPALLLSASRSNTSSAVALALAPRALSHFWQSRAPPSAF